MSSAQYETAQDHIRLLVGKNCDSAMLDLQKFPTLGGNMKLPEWQFFCRKIEEEKKFLPSTTALPVPEGSLSFTGINRGRLLVDHSGGILEADISLHRLFGFPVIPGSALKGIARSMARFDEDKKRFARVFGGEEKGKSDSAGTVAFLMAVPADKNWKMVVDILTSHRGGDTANPVPVFFPAVEKGGKFRFTVCPTARAEDGDLEFAVKYLKKALRENGVGAKTSAGYGYFEIVEG